MDILNAEPSTETKGDFSKANKPIKPAVTKTPEKEPPKFIEMDFHISMISDFLGVSRPLIYNLKNEGKIEGKAVPYGNTEKLVFDWENFAKIKNSLECKIKLVGNKIFVIANLKGGTGKSTLVVQLGMWAAAHGLKVLIIDADPQSNGSMGIVGVEIARDKQLRTLYDVLISKDPIDDAIQELTPLLHLIPANLSMSRIERALALANNRDYRLSEVLMPIRGRYDLVLIDTSPSASLLNTNAFLCADEILIASSTTFLSVTGIASMFELLEELQKDFSELEFGVRIIPNLYDHRNTIEQEALGAMRQAYPEFMTQQVVRKNVDIQSAQKYAQSIWQFGKRSAGAEDLENLASEIFLSANN